MTATVLLPAARYPEEKQVSGFYTRVMENLRRDGSLDSAALVQTIPLGGNNSYSTVQLESK